MARIRERKRNDYPRATEIQILLKIHEALQKTLTKERRGDETRNKSEKRIREEELDRQRKSWRGENVPKRKSSVTINSWQDIADYLDAASEEEGLEYPVGRGTIYQYLKRFEEDFEVPFQYHKPTNETIDKENYKQRNAQKIYRYPEGFKNERLMEYVAAQLYVGGTTRDIGKYLDELDDESSLSIWTKLFLKNFNRRQQLMKAVSFYETDSLTNHFELFGDLLEYIIKKTPIRFYVKGIDKETKEPVNKLVRMHPYLLKNYNQRWFLIGRVKDEHFPLENKYYEPFSPYALNQIVLNPVVDGERQPTIAEWTGTTRTGLTYRMLFDDSTNTEEQMEAFKAAVGVTIQGNLQDVLLRFPKLRYDKYVSTKPLVGGAYQRLGTTSEDGTLVTVRIQTYITKELVQQILSFGPDCEVIAPASLREEIIKHIKTLNRLYGL